MEALLDTRQQFISEDAFHLERHTRHERKSHTFFLQPHARCRAVGVWDVLTRLRQHRLTAVALAHLETATFEQGNHVVVGCLTKLQFSIEKLANRWLSDVISRGTKPSSDQNKIGIHAGVEGIKDGFFGITDSQCRIQLKTSFRQVFAQPGCIRVNHLTYQQFIANRDIFNDYFFHLISNLRKDRPFFGYCHENKRHFKLFRIFAASK